MVKDAMKVAAVGLIALFVLGAVPAAGEDDEDGPRYKDMPNFSGMPKYRILESDDREFDAFNFYNGKGCVAVEGKKFRRAYNFKQEGQPASEIQISRNYAAAVKSMGGTVIFDGECSGADCAENCGGRLMVGKVVKGGNELWIEAAPFNGGGDYYLTVIVKEAMRQDVTAQGLLDALNRDGRVALYINFDTGKATIRPDSRPVVDQVVAMLTANPDLALSVEGHTDNVGQPKANRTLSEQRAKAVVAAIVAAGIKPARLSAAGYGQDKPVADNKTEEGRAKNRRVELVKK